MDGLCLQFHLFQLADAEHEAKDKGEGIGDWSGCKEADESADLCADEHCGDVEDELFGQRGDGGFYGLTNGLEKYAGAHLDSVEEGEQEIDVETLHGKFFVKGGFCAEDTDQLQWEELENEPGDNGDEGADFDAKEKGAAYAVVFLCAVIEAEDGLAAAGDADADGKSDHAHFHAEPESGDRNISTVDRLCAVDGEQVVGNHCDDGGCEVVKTAGKTKAGNAPDDARLERKRCALQLHGFHVEKIGDVAEKTDVLADDGRQCGAFYAPMKNKDEDWVEDGVEDGANHHCEHRKFGAAVGADGGVDGGCEDDSWKSKNDDAAITEGVGHDVFCGAKDVAQRFQKEKCDKGQQDADEKRGDDGAAKAVGGFFGLSFAEMQAEKGCEPVAKQCAKSDGEHGDWCNDVGGAISQKADALTDEDLVDHVVEGVDDKRNDAWYGVADQ